MNLHKEKQVRELIRHLSNAKQTSWFSDPKQRTMENLTQWIQSEMSASRKGSAIQRKLIHTRKRLAQDLCDPGHPRRKETLASVKETARELAELATMTPLMEIASMDDVVTFLDPARFEGKAPLLTTQWLRAELDLVPGGVEFLEKHSAAKIRNAIAKKFSGLWVTPFMVGTRPIQGYLDSTEITHDLLEKANRSLLNCEIGAKPGGRPLAGALLCLLDELQDPRDSEGVARLYDSGIFVNQIKVLRAPRLGKVMAQLRGYQVPKRQQGQLAGDFIDDVVDVLTALAPQDSELYALKQTLWDALVDALGLVRFGLSREENMRRLRDRLGLSDLEAVELADYWRLYQMVKGPGDRRVHQPATVATESRETLNPFELLELVLKYSDGGKVRPRSSIPKADLERIEATLGRPLDATTVAQWSKWGLSKSNTSKGELHLGDVLRSMPLSVRDVKAQYSPDYLGRQSIDWAAMVSLPGKTGREYEVLIECQGEQHFRSAGKMPLRFEADRRKANAILRNSDGKLKRRVLLNLHHKLLADVPEHRKLTGSQLTELIRLAHQYNAWWVFVQPRGSNDYNATPALVSPRRVDEAELAKFKSLQGLDVQYIKR